MEEKASEDSSPLANEKREHVRAPTRKEARTGRIILISCPFAPTWPRTSRLNLEIASASFKVTHPARASRAYLLSFSRPI